jgi:hypothetical protein
VVLLELARDALLDQMADAEGDFGDGRGGDCRLDALVGVARED